MSLAAYSLSIDFSIDPIRFFFLKYDSLTRYLVWFNRKIFFIDFQNFFCFPQYIDPEENDAEVGMVRRPKTKCRILSLTLSLFK
jgi:hypothetical protein